MENTIPLVNFRCKNLLPSGKKCLTIVAQTNGIDLFFGKELVKGKPFYMGFPCKGCGQLVKWKKCKPK
ncbi:MAG: hypothetical protein KG003_13870 [Bacteroidetes bacterium]|nr:hypothetical protein [Bacteroidota bacterium]